MIRYCYCSLSLRVCCSEFSVANVSYLSAGMPIKADLHFRSPDVHGLYCPLYYTPPLVTKEGGGLESPYPSVASLCPGFARKMSSETLER